MMNRQLGLALVLLLLAAAAFAQNNPVTALYPSAVDDTQLGVFADRAYSTLAAAVTSTSTTLTLTDASAFPNAEYWVIVCPLYQCGVGATAANGETIFVTGKSGNVLTIGATGRQVLGDQTGTATGGSNPTHAIGEAVVLAPAAGQMNRWLAELKELHDAVIAGGGGTFVGGTSGGTYADLSSATGMSTGDVYFFDGSDTPYEKAIYNGSSWDPYFRGYKCTPLDVGSFTWVNQGTTSASTVGGSTSFVVPPQVGNNLRLLVKSAPSTPYVITVLMANLQVHNATDIALGPAFRQSSDGKLHGLLTSKGWLKVEKWDSPTSFSASYYQQAIVQGGPYYWMRIANNGTNRVTSVSFDNVNFYELHSVGNTDYLTADQVGVWFFNTGAVDAIHTVLSWEVQ